MNGDLTPNTQQARELTDQVRKAARLRYISIRDRATDPLDVRTLNGTSFVLQFELVYLISIQQGNQNVDTGFRPFVDFIHKPFTATRPGDNVQLPGPGSFNLPTFNMTLFSHGSGKTVFSTISRGNAFTSTPRSIKTRMR